MNIEEKKISLLGREKVVGAATSVCLRFWKKLDIFRDANYYEISLFSSSNKSRIEQNRSALYCTGFSWIAKLHKFVLDIVWNVAVLR